MENLEPIQEAIPAVDDIVALKRRMARNVLLILVSITVAIVLVKTGFVYDYLIDPLENKLIAAFFGGIFFTSLFTAVPATVLLVELAATNSVVAVALVAGAGAAVGDLLLFKFLKSHLTDDLVVLFRVARFERLTRIFHLKTFHWLFAFVGIIIIASPLPDEMGLTLLGLSELKPRVLLPLSYVLNTLGIMSIGYLALKVAG